MEIMITMDKKLHFVVVWGKNYFIARFKEFYL